MGLVRVETLPSSLVMKQRQPLTFIVPIAFTQDDIEEEIMDFGTEKFRESRNALSWLLCA
jgi:hypothetical protein